MMSKMAGKRRTKGGSGLETLQRQAPRHAGGAALPSRVTLSPRSMALLSRACAKESFEQTL